MDDLLDIAEVVRRTGLTSRALRYYESRGLLRPVRTHKDRRLYGARELERINQIVALKQAGLTLAQIGQVLASRPPDLERLVDAQTAALVVRQKEISDALARLIAVRNRLRQGGTADVETLCAMIRQADGAADRAEWRRLVLGNLAPEEKEKARTAMERMWAVLSRVDPHEQRRRLADLYARIEAALPLDIDSPQAEAFHDEWRALQAPLRTMFDPEAPPPAEPVGADEAAVRIERWNREANAPVSAGVFQFLFALESAHERKGRAA